MSHLVFVCIFAVVLGCGTNQEQVSTEAARASADRPSTATSKPKRATCEPGQVNDFGVGRRCTKNADCAGFKASMCSFSKGPDRPRMCIVHCDADEQCGPDAMCGIVRGWIRACFPKRCKGFTYSPDRVRAVKHPPAAKHEGAIVHDAGVAFEAGGWGRRCRDATTCKGLLAGYCNVAIYPPGVPICEKECRGNECGDNAYCSYEETRGFSLCLPRSPQAAHRKATTKPANLDTCKVAGTVVDSTKNEFGVGRGCSTTAQCGKDGAAPVGGTVCGSELTGPRRKPDSCTRPCKADTDCGRNAICVDLDHGLPAPAKPSNTHFCVPGCWAI